VHSSQLAVNHHVATAINTEQAYGVKAEVFSLSMSNPKGHWWANLVGSVTLLRKTMLENSQRISGQ